MYGAGKTWLLCSATPYPACRPIPQRLGSVAASSAKRLEKKGDKSVDVQFDVLGRDAVVDVEPFGNPAGRELGVGEVRADLVVTVHWPPPFPLLSRMAAHGLCI